MLNPSYILPAREASTWLQPNSSGRKSAARRRPSQAAITFSRLAARIHPRSSRSRQRAGLPDRPAARRKDDERTRFSRVASETFAAAPELIDAASLDLQGIVRHDPAVTALLPPLLNFKGLVALEAWRVSRWLWQRGRRDFALLMQSACSERLQVSIHPTAVIGTSVFLDHATGIVIGAYADIGDEVTILQNVTIGRREGEPSKSPRIGRGAYLSSGSTIIGDIAIGDFAKIGAGAVVTHDVPAGCTAVGVPARLVNCPETVLA